VFPADEEDDLDPALSLGDTALATAAVGDYYNALCPTDAGTWQLLTEVALVF
jgi:hypothetical protein